MLLIFSRLSPDVIGRTDGKQLVIGAIVVVCSKLKTELSQYGSFSVVISALRSAFNLNASRFFGHSVNGVQQCYCPLG